MLGMTLIMTTLGLVVIGLIVAIFELQTARLRNREHRSAR